MNSIPNVTETRKINEQAIRQDEIDVVLDSLGNRIKYAAERGSRKTHVSISSLNEAERAIVKREVEAKGYGWNTLGREVTATVTW